MELTFDHLVKHYGNVHALKGINATLTEGVYGLLGPNGAGKSTLMNILSGNLSQTAGAITYNGTDIRKLGRNFHKILGFMPQQQAIYPGFTAMEFLSYVAALRGMKKAEAAKEIPKVLELVELSDVAGRRLKTFSGGMKQRILIAQAILADPEVLILDEPTAGLDPKQRIAIRNLIASIAQRKIVMISTHVVADIACISKEVLLLRQGELLCKEQPHELIRRMEGCVWEVCVPEAALQDWKARYTVSNIANSTDGYCLRILSDSAVAGAAPVTPSLEDVYLHYFGE